MSSQSAEVAAIGSALIADPRVGGVLERLWNIPGDPWCIIGEGSDIALRLSAVRAVNDETEQRLRASVAPDRWRRNPSVGMIGWGSRTGSQQGFSGRCNPPLTRPEAR